MPHDPPDPPNSPDTADSPAAARFAQWGDDLDEQSIQQMHNACSLPVAVAGALMHDAHVGYGLAHRRCAGHG